MIGFSRRSSRGDLDSRTPRVRRASCRTPVEWAINEDVVKKIVALLVLGFVLFYLLTAPTAAADAVTGAFGAVVDAFVQVGVFVERLFR